MNAVDEAFGKELLKAIDEMPKTKCAKCEFDKQNCLFTPSQLKRRRPVCRMCAAKPRKGRA
jgi:hypothetical protein